MFTLGADGSFRRDGGHFVPVGVNFWPVVASTIRRCALAGPKKIRVDLERIAVSGLNTVRVNPSATGAPYRVRVTEHVR